MEEVHFRTYRNSDFDEVWSLHNLALNAVAAHAGKGSWDDDMKNIEEVYLNNNGEFLVAIMDNKIVGMGALRKRDTAIAEIKRMRVRPEYQGKGIGTFLLKNLEARAKIRGYKKLILDTTVKQRVAQKLYENNGYKKTGHAILGGFACLLYEKEIK